MNPEDRYDDPYDPDMTVSEALRLGLVVVVKAPGLKIVPTQEGSGLTTDAMDAMARAFDVSVASTQKVIADCLIGINGATDRIKFDRWFKDFVK